MRDFYIQWHITELCNFNCLHCYKESYRKELDFLGLKKVADNLVNFALFNNLELIFSLTGGEPFLKPQVYEIVFYLDEINCVKKINFITNGSILPDLKIKKLSKLSNIYISLESVDKKINDKIRGINSYDAVLKNLNFFVENFSVGIMTTLMNCNIDYLIEKFEQFLKLLFDLGIKEIIFERFIPVGRAKSLISEVVDYKKMFALYKKISKVFYLDLKELLKFPALKITNTFEVLAAECICGKDGCAVLCDGTVYPCRRYDKEVGNLLYDEMVDIYPVNENFLLKDIKFDYFNCYAMEKSLKCLYERRTSLCQI